MAKNYEKSIRAFLGEGTEFKGVISFEGTVRVDGALEGEVVTEDTFIIGPAARVTARIAAGVVIVMGRVEGKIVAKEKCEVRVGAHVRGDIHTRSIYIEDGAVFEGACRMMGESDESEESEEAEEEAPEATVESAREGEPAERAS